MSAKDTDRTWRVEFAFHLPTDQSLLTDTNLADLRLAFADRLPQGSAWARVHRLTNVESGQDGVAFDVADNFVTPVNALAVVLDAAELALRRSSIRTATLDPTDIRIDQVTAKPSA